MTRANHFITVSRRPLAGARGELWARRKGRPPVLVAGSDRGIEVAPDDDARGRGVPPLVRVQFAHGGGNRELRVLAVEIGGETLDVDVFLARFGVSDAALGRWIRAAVELALDAAEHRDARREE